MSAFFSEQELYYIREHSTWPAEEIAKTLNKTVSDVVLARKTLGLPTYTKRDWNNEEVQFVKANYGKLSVPEMVPLLHRTRHSIQRKVEGSIIPEPDNLKSLIFSAPKKAPNSMKPFSMSEKKQILDDYEKGKSLKQIADQHGRSIVSIQHIVFPNRKERERNSFLYEQHRK